MLKFILIISFTARLLWEFHRVESLGLPQTADSNSIKCDTNLWLKYKQQFWKSYGSKHEDAKRMDVFCKNLRQVNEHNRQASDRDTKLAINHMSDWTEAELSSLLMDLPARSYHVKSTLHNESTLAKLVNNCTKKLPELVDYRLKPNVVGPIQMQGKCGSCWAQATVGLIEAYQHKWNSSIAEVTPLSAQQLVDCIQGYGCAGGWPDVALEHVKRWGGVMSAADYPYISGLCRSDHKCHYKRFLSFPTSELVDKFEILPAGDEEFLKKVVALHGPVMSLLHSTYLFHRHDGLSVFTDDHGCAGEEGRKLNHAVLIVGYGTTMAGEDYWIVKNSWGDMWGNRGFGLMARNRNNSCQVAAMPIALLV